MPGEKGKIRYNKNKKISQNLTCGEKYSEN